MITDSKLICSLILAAGLLAGGTATAQNRSLASVMDVYVFPAKGQEASQQSQDEASCYDWAVGNTGNDPFELQKQQAANEQQAQAEMQAASQAGAGSGTRGALRGAAAGALIGEIGSGDAGRGAAYGAAAGVLAGRHRGNKAEYEAQSQAAARADQRAAATEGEIENFKKAFSVCLEAKEYMVKY